MQSNKIRPAKNNSRRFRKLKNTRLAMFGELRQLQDPTPQTEKKWMYGAWLATARLLREFLKDGLVDSLDCFAPIGHSRTETVMGRECREIPFTHFPLEAKLNRYETLFSYFGWNSGLPSLRAQILPHASHIQVVHSMHYERTLWDFGCNLYWELGEPYDAIVCTSPTSVSTLRSMTEYWQERSHTLRGKKIEFPAKIVEIPLGVDLPAVRPDRQRARARLGWNSNDLIILVVGRLTAFDKMDHGSILAIFSGLGKKAGKRLQFVFAGEDTQQGAKTLMQVAEKIGVADRLRIYTNFEYDLREDLYAASDIFFSPADHLQETFGLTILEAMAHGLPIVASDWGGYRDLVQHGRTGFLVSTFWGGRLDDFGTMAGIDAMTSTYDVSRRTVVNLAEAEQVLIDLIKDEQLRRSMGQAARKRVEAHFTWPTVISRYRGLWEELAEIRARTPGSKRKLPSPRGHDYRHIFAHYPTWQVSGHDRVSARVSLDHARQTNPIFLLSHEQEQNAIAEILSVLEKKSQTIEACARRVSELLGLPPERVQDHLLLAAKYGLIEIKSSDRRKSRRS
jgi:D-inositol-3-phosphate glycosyltransferase